MIVPMPCRREHFDQPWYGVWASSLGVTAGVDHAIPHSYRKLWEFAAIAQALDERGYLTAGRKGLGFAVGREPLPCIFASRGAEILATDLGVDASRQSWVTTNQHAASRDAVYHPYLIDRIAFDSLVDFRPVDMNAFSDLPSEQLDFLWSSCAFEHLGTLEHGLRFVENAMRLLKSGGIAVHTTEYNVSSNDDTIFEGDACIYRRRDFEELDRRLRRIRCGIEPMNFESGSHVDDLNYDEPPFFQSGRPHIKLKLGDFVCTSYLIIVHKG